MNGRDRAAIFEERNQSGAGIKDDPTNDPGGGRSHEYCPQVEACPMCNLDVAENKWFEDIAFCTGCAKAAGLSIPKT